MSFEKIRDRANRVRAIPLEAWSSATERRESQAMNESFLSPIHLNENPELAALWILKTNLDVAQMALAATYPDSREPSYSERCRSEQEAYALSILYQIDALNAMLNEYAESLRRLREWRSREPPAADITF